ncbi:hypothetical protein QZH56_11720 [Streptomyces olivoreticuli]|uniref:hypothetical protein n=1 Tax=Streptomyces TaxID=1883 RepID=UPI00265A0DC8|nr:hypothetical protein [Streptomyces olivoreticuli]WKK26197.1 hypothetical protein QZH56_11720 [Streptomyces olivoreticuli]
MNSATRPPVRKSDCRDVPVAVSSSRAMLCACCTAGGMLERAPKKFAPLYCSGSWLSMSAATNSGSVAPSPGSLVAASSRKPTASSAPAPASAAAVEKGGPAG